MLQINFDLFRICYSGLYQTQDHKAMGECTGMVDNPLAKKLRGSQNQTMTTQKQMLKTNFKPIIAHHKVKKKDIKHKPFIDHHNPKNGVNAKLRVNNPKAKENGDVEKAHFANRVQYFAKNWD